VLGVVANPGEAELDAQVAELVARRDEARAAGDFAASDRIREQIVNLGWIVEDTPGGTRVYR